MEIQSEPVVLSLITDGVRVAIIGSVHTNVSWLESSLVEVTERKPKVVELDLSRTDFLSSTGVGILVSFRSRIVAAGGTLRVTAIHRNVKGTMVYAHIDRLFALDQATVV